MRTAVEKPARADHPVASWIAARWSPRAMDPKRRLPEPQLRTLLEAARWAPSCFNEQPWRYLVFDHRDEEARRKAEACLAPGNAWAKSAAVLAIAVARETFTHNGKPNRHHAHDLGAANLAMALQATALGLVMHQMGGFDPNLARSLFRIPEGFTPLTMIAIGYAGEVESLSAEQRAMEAGPRVRRPQSEFVFFGDFPAETAGSAAP